MILNNINDRIKYVTEEKSMNITQAILFCKNVNILKLLYLFIFIQHAPHTISNTYLGKNTNISII